MSQKLCQVVLIVSRESQLPTDSTTNYSEVLRFMDTVQIFFRTPNTRNQNEILDKVHSYLAALANNGKVIEDHTPLARARGGYVVTVSVPESTALADRVASKWVRKRLRELTGVGVERPKVKHLGTNPESRAPCKCRSPFECRKAGR